MNMKKQSVRYFLFGIGAGSAAVLSCILTCCIFRKCRCEKCSTDDQTILIRDNESDKDTENL